MDQLSYHIVFSPDVSNFRAIHFCNHSPAQDLLCIVLLESKIILVVSIHAMISLGIATSECGLCKVCKLEIMIRKVILE
jgi:hypothetical protein